MTSVNISLREDIYRKLKSFKSEDESFSDLIEKLLKNMDIEGYYGVLSGMSEDEERSIEEAKKELRLMEEMDHGPGGG